jgi:hypothetical protein
VTLDLSLLSGDASEMETTRKRSWWSYARLSLRGLILLVSVVGCGLGVIAHYIRSASIQREAVAAIKKLNGSVLYDFQFEGTKLRLVPGSNAGLTHLKGLTNFESLEAGPTKTTYGGMLELQRALPNLRTRR